MVPLNTRFGVVTKKIIQSNKRLRLESDLETNMNIWSKKNTLTVAITMTGGHLHTVRVYVEYDTEDPAAPFGFFLAQQHSK